MQTIEPAQVKLKRHPIRGFLYGIFFGLGLAMVVVGQGLAALGTWPPFIVLIAGIVVGTTWSTYGPAKAPKGPPPTGATLADQAEPAQEPAPEVSPLETTADGTLPDEPDEPLDHDGGPVNSADPADAPEEL